MLSAASQPTLAKNARMGHPRSDMGNERKDCGQGWATRQNCAYVYDDLARLASANCGSSVWSQTFSYDAFGNITKSVPSGSTGIAFQSVYNGSTNWLSSVGNVNPTYDNNGNLKYDTAHNLAWDAEGKMLNVDSTTVQLTYDAFGRAVEQNRGGSYTQTVYAPSGAKLALMSGMTLVKAFVRLPGGPTAVYAPGTPGPIFYRHADWLGSSRLASTQSRTKYFDVSYAPFGENYNPSGTTDYNFTGQNQDTVTGYDDFLFREYSSVQGRWMSPDPAGLAAVRLASPQSWNRYAYVLNNPLGLVDPLGLDCVYVTDDGSRVESIDYNSNEGECGASGGYWIEGSVNSASWVTVDPNTGIVSGYGVTWDGFIEFSVAGAMGSNLWGAWTQTFGVNGPTTTVDVTDTGNGALNQNATIIFSKVANSFPRSLTANPSWNEKQCTVLDWESAALGIIAIPNAENPVGWITGTASMGLWVASKLGNC